MSSAASLPAASPSTVLAVFLRVFEADNAETFRREDLQQRGVAQYRQAVTLLRFLRLTTDAGLLEEDVCAARQDPAQFRQLLGRRFQAACREAGFWDEGLAEFGTQEMTRARLGEVLATMRPIQRQNSPAARTNMIGCLRTLHSVFLHGDPDWLRKNLDARHAVRKAAAVGPGLAAPSLRPEGAAWAGAGTGNRGGEPAGLPADVVVGQERIHVGYTDEGDDVFVEAWFSPPLASLTRQQLFTLAKQLQKRARAIP